VAGARKFTAVDNNRGAILIVPSLIVVLIGIFYLSQGHDSRSILHLFGREVIVKEAYRFAMGKLGKFVLTSFLVALAAFGFTLVVLLIGVAAYFAFSLFTSGWWSAVTCVSAANTIVLPDQTPFVRQGGHN